MAKGWTPKAVVDKTNPLPIKASLSAAPIGEFPIFSGGALNGLVIGVFVSDIAGTVSVQLQHAFARDSFSDVTGKTVSLSNGWNYIKLNGRAAGDIALMPLYDRGRLTLTSNGSGAGTIEYVGVLQEL